MRSAGFGKLQRVSLLRSIVGKVPGPGAGGAEPSGADAPAEPPGPDRDERRAVPGAAQQDLVPELQQPRRPGADHGEGRRAGEELPERGRGGEGWLGGASFLQRRKASKLGSSGSIAFRIVSVLHGSGFPRKWNLGEQVGKGTAITDCEDAELVFFVKGLPTEGHQKWLPPLLRSVQSTLVANLPEDMYTSIQCTDDSVQMDMKGTITVHMRFSPAFENYVKTVQALGALGPYARKPFEPSFVKERTQFVAKQPGHVKVTMRLLKWWRDQQAWSCALTRPSDFALELIAIYASQQCGKARA